MRFGFDPCGGFVAIDHSRQRAAYAYPSSPHAERAAVEPLAVALEMASNWYGDDQPFMAEIELRLYLSLRASDRPEWATT